MKHFLLFLLVPFYFWGQSPDSVAWKSDLLERANWPKAKELSIPFQFSTCITVRYKLQRLNGTSHVHYYCEAQWLRQQSFLAESAKGTKPLAQLFFDCFELEARKIQETVNVENEFDVLDVKGAEARAKQRVVQINQETEDGQNTARFHYWRSWMDSALSATPRADIPDWENKLFGLGVDVGLGSTLFGGHLGTYFKPIAGFVVGGAIRLSRVYIDMHIMQGNTSARQEFKADDFKFAPSSRLTIKQTCFSLGVDLLKNARWSVMPYGGLCTLHVINHDEPQGSLYRNGPVSFGVEGGMLTEWRFHALYQDNQGLLSWKLRLKTGFSGMNYLKEIRGTMLNIQVGIGFTLNAIRNVPIYR